jgi:hypothetical protein
VWAWVRVCVCVCPSVCVSPSVCVCDMLSKVPSQVCMCALCVFGQHALLVSLTGGCVCV